MKSSFLLRLCALTLALCMAAPAALAAKARSISGEADSRYHAAHLERHIRSQECRATGNYIKVLSRAGGDVLGHLEQADSFILLAVTSGLAEIEVTAAAETSPDSWTGLRGFVNADYIDCACSDAAYHGKQPPRTDAPHGGQPPRGNAPDDPVRYVCTTNNLRVRSRPVDGDIVGHIEIADRFTVHAVKSGWANITVTYADPSSPDSWAGLNGWVSMDYLARQEPAGSGREPWKRAYLEYLTEKGLLNYLDEEEFWLFDLNNDDIPELGFDTHVTAGGFHILTYHNGKVSAEVVGANGYTYYIEKENLLLNSSGQMGTYDDSVYTIKNGKWTIIYYAENCSHYIDDNGCTRYEYYADGQAVSEAKYYELLDAHFDRSRSIKLVNGTSVKQLRRVLAE